MRLMMAAGAVALALVLFGLWVLTPVEPVSATYAQSDCRVVDLIDVDTGHKIAGAEDMALEPNGENVIISAYDRSNPDDPKGGLYRISLWGLDGATWYEATKSEFRGLSRDALKFISADRCWVEITAFHDLTLVYSAALKRMPDAVVSIADTLRGIAVDALERQDAPVVDNVVRTFNAMVRMAIVDNEIISAKSFVQPIKVVLSQNQSHWNISVLGR